jgi:Ca2+-binding EF-hand superfamily protein
MIRNVLLASLFATAAAGSALAGAPAVTSDHLTVADRDGDGRVDLVEYRVMTSNVFILLDADASDTLTPEEASAIPAELFKAMDGDGDGFASRAEYDAQVLIDFRAADLDDNGLLN